MPKYTLRSTSFVFLSVFSLQFGNTHVSESSLLTIITFIQFPYWYSEIIILFYKMFRKVCAPWLVRTRSLHFRKARALHFTSALLRYTARSLGHRNERIHFIKELKKLVPQALLSYIGTWEFLRTLPHFSRVLKNSCVLIELNYALGAFLFL